MERGWNCVASYFGYQSILDLLDTVEEDAYTVHWWIESEDGQNTLTNAPDGDEEEAHEFRVAFADLESKCEQLRETLEECYGIEDYFDDCTVALVGNRYESLGFDGYQEDYIRCT